MDEELLSINLIILGGFANIRTEGLNTFLGVVTK